jgi:hypothetical protein
MNYDDDAYNITMENDSPPPCEVSTARGDKEGGKGMLGREGIAAQACGVVVAGVQDLGLRPLPSPLTFSLYG